MSHLCKKLTFFALFIPFLTVNGQKSQKIEDFNISSESLFLIEEHLQSLDNDNSFDFVEILEYLYDLQSYKFNLNEVSAENLQGLFLLSDIQINNFELYRSSYGPLISIYELQSIPGFDVKSIKRILPFVKIETKGDFIQSSLYEQIRDADHELLVRSQRTMESLKGHNTTGGFAGNPFRHYLRYKLRGLNLKVGFQAEKDVGEEFFSGNNAHGFDFYSFYFSMQKINHKIRSVHLGDFTASMGQGLIVHNQFGSGLTSFTTNIKKAGKPFSSYTSRNEVNFYRGLAMKYQLNRNISSAFFASHKSIDGTLRDRNNDGVLESFSSIDITGNHRTATELSKRNTIDKSSLGGTVEYKNKNFKFSLNSLVDRFDKTFSKTRRPDNIFFPDQKTFANTSFDYSIRLLNLNLFGESAYSAGGGFAHIIGALIGLDRKLDLSLVYRNYSPRYIALEPNSFGQGSNSNNEKGLYLGMEIRPLRDITINAYADFWQNPWLRFRVDSPDVGHEYLLKITYAKKRKFTSYALVKSEFKSRNSQLPSTIDVTIPQRTSRFRLHFNNHMNRTWELRNRVEISHYTNDIENVYGVLVYQDVLYRPIDFPLSVTGRIMWFDIGDFDARIYAYENDVLYDFSVPFYNGNGWRYYFNFKYRIAKYSLELRIAQTRLSDQKTIGSGLNAINGNHQTTIKAQLRWKF